MYNILLYKWLACPYLCVLGGGFGGAKWLNTCRMKSRNYRTISLNYTRSIRELYGEELI